MVSDAAGHPVPATALATVPGTALIVEVPEAEAVVGAHRLRLDPQAARGVPAHITVLFPFLPPALIDDRVHAELAELCARVRPFDFVLDRTAWFGQDVLWLGPADPLPFRAATELVFGAYPQYPPFGGQFDEVVPHLTVGHQSPLAELQAAEQAVLPLLPVAGRVEQLTLMMQAGSGRWERSAAFPLGR
jgi:hypothetical protein